VTDIAGHAIRWAHDIEEVTGETFDVVTAGWPLVAQGRISTTSRGRWNAAYPAVYAWPHFEPDSDVITDARLTPIGSPLDVSGDGPTPERFPFSVSRPGRREDLGRDDSPSRTVMNSALRCRSRVCARHRCSGP
jgi:hypothetical protein